MAKEAAAAPAVESAQDTADYAVETSESVVSEENPRINFTKPEAKEEPEAAEDNGGDDYEEPEERGRKNAQSRIQELARERAAERQRADRLEAMLAQQMGMRPQAQQPQPDPFSPPDPNMFPAGRFDPNYLDAVAEYKVNARIEQRVQQEKHRQTSERIASSEEAFAKEHKDYKEAKKALMENPMIAHHPGIGEAVVNSAHPAELIYVLASNPSVAEQIANMLPVHAAMQLGKIEALIEAQIEMGGSVRKGGAPAPISPIGGKGAVASRNIQSAKSYDEFVAIREAQEKARRAKKR